MIRKIFSSLILVALLFSSNMIAQVVNAQENNEVNEKQLKLNKEEAVIGGVCAGIADFFGWEVEYVRIAFIISLLFGVGELLYPILWILMS